MKKIGSYSVVLFVITIILLFNYTVAGSLGGCGDHFEYVSFNDDPGDHDDDS